MRLYPARLLVDGQEDPGIKELVVEKMPCLGMDNGVLEVGVEAIALYYLASGWRMFFLEYIYYELQTLEMNMV